MNTAFYQHIGFIFLTTIITHLLPRQIFPGYILRNASNPWNSYCSRKVRYTNKSWDFFSLKRNLIHMHKKWVYLCVFLIIMAYYIWYSGQKIQRNVSLYIQMRGGLMRNSWFTNLECSMISWCIGSSNLLMSIAFWMIVGLCYIYFWYYSMFVMH